MCKIFKISRSSYYKWLKTEVPKRTLENQQFTKEIIKIFNQSKQTYGSPRVTEALKHQGFKISKKRVAKLMRKSGLKSKVKKRYRVTTNSTHKYSIADNILNRQFIPDAINKAWVSDITYIRTRQGWLYLTIILDLFDRQIIGWSLSTTMHAGKTIVPAWEMAISKRNVTSKLIFHSDRGVQYACDEFKKLINKNKLIIQSMSRKANCWDNAVAESFFKTLKTECIYHQEYNTIQNAKLVVFEYIEIWYNRKRLHSSLGYLTPFEYEQNYYKTKLAA